MYKKLKKVLNHIMAGEIYYCDHTVGHCITQS